MSLEVTQGHLQHNHSIERTRRPIYSNLIETMRLSRTVFEILSLIFQKLNKSRDSDHAPYRNSLSSEGWDLL